MSIAYTYILTNQHNVVLYVGSTTDLKKRVYMHRNRLIPGFTKKYNVTKLVYFETLASHDEALARERLIKGGSRAKKVALIQSQNSTWQDLYSLLK
jgi:putative endonuclease